MGVSRPGLSDWGGQPSGSQPGLINDWINSMKPKPPPSIARPTERTIGPSPTSNYIQPQAPYVPPSYSPMPAQQPYYGNAPAQSNWGTGASNGGGGFASGGGGGGMAGGGGGGTAAAAQAQPKPMSEKDWLAGDTEYQNELTGYDNTLKDYLARILTQEEDFKTDFGTAMKGFGRNRDRSMLSMGEDFTSRGLANSGMFNDSSMKQEAQFKEQENGLNTAKSRGLADFGTQRSDKTRSTETQKGNARRSSLARMAQKEQF